MNGYFLLPIAFSPSLLAGRHLKGGRMGVVRNGMATCPNGKSKPASDQAFKGLPDAEWDVAYDVQVGDVCREKLASPARLELSGKSHCRNEIQRWNRGN